MKRKVGSMVDLISIIVPIYNTQKYLAQCIDSILYQTYEKIEILCINDGSTDDSISILLDYAARDGRIKLISHENVGASRARNEMMGIASGEYIMFLDSDDYLEPNAVERALKCIESSGADIAVFDAQDFDDLTGNKIDHSYLRFKPTEKCREICAVTHPEAIFSFTSTVCWNKIYRRSFLMENELIFLDYSNHEDVYFSLAALLKASSVALLDEKLVFYRRNRKDSLMQSHCAAKSCAVEAYIDAFSRLKGQLTSPELVRGFKNKAFGSIRFALDFCSNVATFKQMYDELVKIGFDALEMNNMSESDFYKKSDARCYTAIKNGCAEDYLLLEFKQARKSLAVARAQQISLKTQNDELNENNKAIFEKCSMQEEQIEKLGKSEKALKRENTQLKKQLSMRENEIKRIRASKSFKLAGIIRKIFTLGGRIRLKK